MCFCNQQSAPGEAARPGWSMVPPACPPSVLLWRQGQGWEMWIFFLVFLSFYRPLSAGDPATAVWGVNPSLFYFLRSTDPLCIIGLPQKYISSMVPCSFKEIKPLLSYTAPRESAAKFKSRPNFCSNTLKFPSHNSSRKKSNLEVQSLSLTWPSPMHSEGLLSAWKLIIQHIIRAFNMKKYIASSYSS